MFVEKLLTTSSSIMSCNISSNYLYLQISNVQEVDNNSSEKSELVDIEAVVAKNIE